MAIDRIKFDLVQLKMAPARHFGPHQVELYSVLPWWRGLGCKAQVDQHRRAPGRLGAAFGLVDQVTVIAPCQTALRSPGLGKLPLGLYVPVTRKVCLKFLPLGGF